MSIECSSLSSRESASSVPAGTSGSGRLRSDLSKGTQGSQAEPLHRKRPRQSRPAKRTSLAEGDHLDYSAFAPVSCVVSFTCLYI